MSRRSRLAGALLLALAALAPALPAAPRQGHAEVVAALARADELIAAGELEEAIAVLRAADAPTLPRFYGALLRVRVGELERGLGRWSEALATLDGAAAVLGEARPSRQLRSYLLAVRAQVNLDWGLLDVAAVDVARARELLDGLEPVADQPEPDMERMQVDQAEATLHAAREDYLELEHLVARALRHDVYARHPVRAALLSARLGMGFWEASRLAPELAPRARVTLEQALAVDGLPALERVAPELALAELALRERRWGEAEGWIARATEHLGTPEKRARLLQHANWLALRARLALDRDDRDAASALARAELVELRDALATAQAASLAEWSARDLRPGGYGFLQYPEQRSTLSGLIRLELRLANRGEGAARALAALARAGDASTLARRLGAGPIELERARGELLGPPEEHALLVYLPAPDRSHLFVADRERTAHVLLEPHDVLAEARQAALDALGRVQGEAGESAQREWHAALERLARLLLPDEARAALGTRTRLTVVGRDLLGDVPLEALPLAPGRWLGTAYAVSHLPSLAVGRALAARAASEAQEGPAEALLLAAPSASGLSLARAEAHELLAAYPGPRRLLFGTQATAAGLATCGGARVLEVFTHGRRDAARERPMTLLLEAEGGGAVLVGAEEIEALDAPPLVVLSVCRSGQGPKRRGDAGASELAAAFFLAGARARCVVASAFDLDAEATRRLSRLLHEGLARGLAPDEALRAARAALAQDERFADPRFHGLVAASGAAREPLFRR